MASVRGRVLVVEDDPEINELVGAYAQIAGFHYDAALNGTVALSKAHSELPALILLDVMLPDLDGFEVCRRLKNDEATSRIPVIIFTALDRDEYRLLGQQCGAVAYVTKPFDPERLMETIRQIVSENACLTEEP